VTGQAAIHHCQNYQSHDQDGQDRVVNEKIYQCHSTSAIWTATFTTSSSSLSPDLPEFMKLTSELFTVIHDLGSVLLG
jgi:hypothetical protein